MVPFIKLFIGVIQSEEEGPDEKANKHGGWNTKPAGQARCFQAFSYRRKLTAHREHKSDEPDKYDDDKRAIHNANYGTETIAGTRKILRFLDGHFRYERDSPKLTSGLRLKWCPMKDSHLHAFRHRILSSVCLLFHQSDFEIQHGPPFTPFSAGRCKSARVGNPTCGTGLN